MKRSLIFVFLLLILLSEFAHTQTSLFGGFRIDNDFLSTNNLPVKHSPFILDPALNLGLKIGRDFSLEGRFGLLLQEDYGGIQLGFYAKENILNDNIYLLGGINLLNSFGTSHGLLIHSEGYGASHTMLGGGIGFSASDNFSLELQYLKTLDEEFGRDYYTGSNMQTVNEYWKLYNIFKLGFAYNFSLTSGPQEEKAVLEKRTEESPAHEKSVFGGFRIDYNFLTVSSFPGAGSTLNLGPTLNLGLKLGRDFSVEGRLGLLLSEDLNAMLYGLYARENILSDVVYVLGGVNFLHATRGPRFYSNWTFGSYFNTLLGGGLGINASKSFSIELQYLKTLNEDFGQSSFSFLNGQVYTQNWKLGNTVKIGFAYNYSFPL